MKYRNDDFPWLPTKNGDPLPPESLVASCSVDARTYTAIEGVEPDVWLTERDGKRVLALTEQVRGQSDSYAMALLLAEMDED